MYTTVRNAVLATSITALAACGSPSKTTAPAPMQAPVVLTGRVQQALYLANTHGAGSVLVTLEYGSDRSQCFVRYYPNEYKAAHRVADFLEAKARGTEVTLSGMSHLREADTIYADADCLYLKDIDLNPDRK